jgi:uncharacterized repeat protein (TIGR01451 family)
VANPSQSPIPPWVLNGPYSRWIDPRPDANNGIAAGNFTYTTTFNLTGYDPTALVIVGRWAADDNGVSITLNGSPVAGVGTPSYSAFSSNFVITGPFNAGLNTLAVKEFNSGGPGGLRVDLFGVDSVPADLSVTKTASAPTATPGGSVNYTVTVTNNGSYTVSGIPVTDSMPANITSDTWSVAYGGSGSSGPASGSGNINVPITLGPGGTATFTITAQITTTMIGPFTNMANVGVPNGIFDPNLANNTASTTITVNKFTSSITLVSSASTATVIQGVTFTTTVTSSGPQPTGTVTFFDGSTALGTVALNGSGLASFTVPNFHLGNHLITAVYSGDALNSSATSAAFAEVIQAAPPIIATGADAGDVAVVNVYDAGTQQLKFVLAPFGLTYTGGVRVAVGDITGAGVPDIICGAGPGGGPQVNVYNGATGQLILTFFGMSPVFTGGIFVAAGDLSGTGADDIIVGAGEGGGPQVTVWSGTTGAQLASFYAFSSGFTGGVRVAAGDVTGSGYASIVCAAGAGGGPEVTVYDGQSFNMVSSFYALAATFTGGVYVAAGKVFGGTTADIICGAGAGGGPEVTIYDINQHALANFYATGSSYTGGVRVGTANLTGSGSDALLTALGSGAPSGVSVFDISASSLLNAFYAYGVTTAGVYVS